MANPTVTGPDGVARESVYFSTSLSVRFFSGTIPVDAVDVQVSIDGSGFSSDPDLVQWGDGAWTVPNPLAEPEGLYLSQGLNTVEIRAILPSGSVTPSAAAQVRIVDPDAAGVVAAVPTNISVNQKNASVEVRAEVTAATGFQGLNFYASAFPGGGAEGYTQVNVSPVAEGTTETEDEEFGSLEVSAEVPVDGEGNPLADPLYYRLAGSQEDEGGTTLQSDFTQRYEAPETARTVKITSTLVSVRSFTQYSFDHSRTAGPTSTPATVRVGSFAVLDDSVPLYYVVTGLYYDATLNIEYESSFSEEVVGRPVSVTSTLQSIPVANRQEIVQEWITAVFRSNPQVKVEAGSALRDTVIDPFAQANLRLRFIQDFFNRARTPDLLIQIDDPSGSNESLPVSQSPYKQALQAALFLNSSQAAQDLIDSAFEAAASNYGKKRLSGTASQGEVTFFTTRRPTQTLPLPLGTIVSGGGVQFSTTRASSIEFANLASYFDPVTGRYEVTVPVKCLTLGTAGNVGRGQINSVVSNLPGSLSVVNAAAPSPGRDRESNLELTVRVRNALASVDSGTAQGYLQTAADQPGVTQAEVVAAGDPLMQRDLDDGGVHRGGKVDVWVQGTNLATVTDTFAFTFEIGQDIQFEVIGDPEDLTFQAVDSLLSESNPIIEMLDDPDAGYEFRNASSGEVFDLTGVTVTSFNTIQLDTSITQPSVAVTDVVLGSYRRRAGNTFVLPRQPVNSVTSVVGVQTGDIPSTAFSLIRPDAPLQEGRSILAQAYIQISSFTGEDGSTLPSGDPIPVTDESHVLLGTYPESVDNLGANFLTVVVKSADGVTTYKGPDDPSGSPDYTITLGTQTTALSITRVEGGSIVSGDTVLVSYEHDENFTVTYTTNLIVTQTQDAIDTKKHATADVLAKESPAVPLGVQATVVLVQGRDRATVDAALRTNLTNYFNNLRLSEAVRQSDLIRVIENTEGVSYVVVPLSVVLPEEGALLIREAVSTDTASESTFVTSLSTNQSSVYLLNKGLQFATTDGGGPEGEFRGVFQDDAALTLLEASASLSSLGVSSSRAYILGLDGRSIEGVSDDATLQAQGYTTSEALDARRKELTANRVLVSLAVGSAPPSFSYAVTYVVTTDPAGGAKNVDPGAAQYVSEGEFLFTYDEDQ